MQPDLPGRASSLAQRVTIGVLTALPHEWAAMKTMLDRPVEYRAPGRGSAHDYVLGEIPARAGGTHVVALSLGDQGNPNSAAHATTLLSDFNDVLHIVMVGIAGGAPNPAKPETHVRLGDVVFPGEKGVVKYDFKKEHGDNMFEERHPPRPPSPVMRQAARRLHAEEKTKRPWIAHMLRAAELQFSRPADESDRLAATDNPAIWLEHPHDERRRPGEPRIIEGTIGAADLLQKNPVRRDWLRDRFDVRAIEMEGFGVAEAAHVVEAGFFVVRGICDYCDVHKANSWQDYAAVAAAAFARALLEEVSVTPVSTVRDPHQLAFSTAASAEGRPLARAPASVPFTAPHGGLRVELPESDAAVEREHKAQLDMVRSLLLKGHAQLALEQLQELKTRVWSAASRPVRARILTIIGHCEFDLGHFEAAGKALVEALGEDGSDARTVANGALGHTLLENWTAAVGWARKALELDPTNTIARQVAIQHDVRPDAEVIAEHEAVVGRRSEVYFALGQRAGRLGDARRAAEWFEKAMALAGDQSDILAATGQSLVDSVIDGVFSRAYAWEPPSEADAVTLRRGVGLIDQAWALLKDDEVRRSRVHWLASAASARRVLGEHDAAVQASELALHAAGPILGLRRLRAALAADRADYAKVIELLSTSDAEDGESLGLLAAARANQGEHDAALILWRRLRTLDLPPRLREQTERNEMLTLIEASRADDARVLLRELLDDNATLARYLLGIDTAVRLGDQQLRDELVGKALGLATRDAAPRVLLRLGDALMDATRPLDALSVYALVIPDAASASERDTRRMLVALYRAGHYETALTTCSRVIAVGRMTRFCTEMTSVMWEELGNLPEARRACEDYLSRVPADTLIRVRLCIIRFREGDTEAATRIADGISIAEAVEEFEVGATFAKMLLENGREATGVEVLYQLRRRHIGNASAHLLFIGEHGRFGRVASEPTVVAPDVAVLLEGTDAPDNWMLITQEATVTGGPSEIAPTDPIARTLEGRRIGEVISFPSAPRRKWTLKELASKYVFAFRQSLTEFGRRFPDDPRLEQNVVPDDMDQFLSDLKERLAPGEPRIDRMTSEYGKNRMATVGAIGTVLGKEPAESLGIAMASPHGLIASANTPEERRLAAAALTRDDVMLVADYTALFLMNEVDVLEEAFTGRIVGVTQTTVDACRYEVAKWRSTPDEGVTSLGVHDGELRGSVLGPAAVEQIRARYERLFEWIRRRATVLSVAPAVAQRHADTRKISDHVGGFYWDAVLATTVPGRILVSDDLKLRMLARSLFNVDGVASVHLLLAQRALARVRPEKCADALLRLSLANYRHVATDASMLEAAARMEKWTPFGAFARVASTLKGPDSEVDSAVIVAADFFKVMWFCLVMPQQRDALCLAVIDALVAGRRANDVLARLRKALRLVFRLLPDAIEDATRVLALWSRIHVVS